MALAAHFNANWELVENKVPFEREFLFEAAQLGAHLVQAISVDRTRKVKTDGELDWSGIRARAFRLLVSEYDELRSAIGFLRCKQGEASAFAPALHLGARKGRRARKGGKGEV